MAFRSRALWLAATVMATLAPVAQAEEPARGAPAAASDDQRAGGEDIVVTARKREERLIDIPQSVSVISADALARVHAERFADYFTRVPSASIVESQAGQTRLVLRGISTNGVGATVATYVDETPYGSATSLANGAILTPDIDPFDLERVEILRGPQGTLYGANSLGGLVKYVTVAPQTDAVHAAAQGGFESVGKGETGWSGRAAVNVPLGDRVAVRGSGFYRTDPGYIDDPVRGPDVNGGRTYGGRGSVLVRPFDSLSLRGTAFVQNLESNGSNTIDADPVTLRPTLGDLKQSRLVAEPNHVKYRIYNVTADYDFGPVSLLSSTSWGALDQRQIQDISGLYGPLLSDPSVFGISLGAIINQNVTQRRFTQEVRLASSGASAFDWTLGGFYTRERNMIDQSIDAIADPTGAHVPGLDGLAFATVTSAYREIAGFASGTYHFSPKFDLSVGGRYSHNTQRATQTSSGPLAGGDFSFGGSSSDNVFTYSVAPAFKPNDHLTLYARVARGYRPGGPNVLPPAAPSEVPREFAPDTTTDYEIGIKTELLDRRLSFELTGFYTDWNNIQLIASIGGFGVNTNGGKASSKGVELSATAKPVPGLTLAASGAYFDAVLNDDAPAVVGGHDGDRLPYAPRFASTLSADYERALGDRVTGTIGASWRYTGDRRSAFTAGAAQHRLDAYGQVDAHVGVSFDRFRLDAFVRNLTDSRGIQDVGAAGSARNGAIAVAVSRPRSFGATLGVRY
ncbi:TonB-dependent receptor [Sphingomonas sp. QA11]|uniref:TonB-dependent receptor n=1 Tax=Sphingomonas sp. QA11 TaxID=2950605 RepID=UPI00234A3391|nr:TonB-dependent receptor [Sphingomonas sp. QA11]WCM26044.1 TonB-dependent receptor [Sphingomonas sp. QA11]